MKLDGILSFLAVGGLLLASCSNEENPGNVLATSPVYVTMSASIEQPSDNLSRNELTEVAPGDINFYWTKGDAVVAVTDGGTVAGVLVAQEGGAATSELSGSLMLKDDEYNLTYYFLGNGVAVPEAGTAFDYTHSIANQSGAASEMKNHGIMATTGSVKISGGVAAAQEIMLNHLMTFAHFEMVLAESMKGSSYEVTVSGANVNNTVAVAKGAITASNDETGCIKVGNALDFYMTVAPAKQMAFTFTVKVDGDKEYTASLPAVDIAASKFLRKSFGVGIPVVFEEPEAPVDITKNPLWKWAETNLVYDKTTGTSSFAASYSDKGYLYQWGRNVGFADYKEATGDCVRDADKVYTFEFGAYDQISLDDSYANFPHAGTPAHQEAGYLYSEYGHWIKTVDDLRALTDAFVMDGTYDASLYNGDYWITRTFGDGGTDWASRAAACGYSASSPCPEGWHIPTEAEWREIVPQTNYNANRTLTNLLSSSAELRQLADGTKYVMRWVNESNCVKAQAILVGADFTQSDISTIEWTSEDVVTRYFPFNGMIRGARYRQKNNLMYDYDRVARPLPLCSLNSGLVSYAYGQYYQLELSVKVDYSAAISGYWTSDAKMAFKFGDKNLQSAIGNSYLLYEAGDPETAYAVRCVKNQ